MGGFYILSAIGTKKVVANTVHIKYVNSDTDRDYFMLMCMGSKPEKLLNYKENAD